MNRLGLAMRGIWEFVAGDDWITAGGVVLALGLTALLGDSAPAWLVMPLAVAVLLALSIWRTARRGSGP